MGIKRNSTLSVLLPVRMARDNLHLILQLKFCYMQVYNTGELRFRWGVASRLYESTNPEVPRRNKPGIWVSLLKGFCFVYCVLRKQILEKFPLVTS